MSRIINCIGRISQKVSLLLNLPCKMTVELTFENVFQCSAHDDQAPSETTPLQASRSSPVHELDGPEHIAY